MWNVNENEKTPWEINSDEMKDIAEEADDAFWQDYYEELCEQEEAEACESMRQKQMTGGPLSAIRPDDQGSEKRIVQVAVFQGGSRFDDFNKFAKENEIGDEDIISISDDSMVNGSVLKLFYLI